MGFCRGCQVMGSQSPVRSSWLSEGGIIRETFDRVIIRQSATDVCSTPKSLSFFDYENTKIRN